MTSKPPRSVLNKFQELGLGDAGKCKGERQKRPRNVSPGLIGVTDNGIVSPRIWLPPGG